MTLKQYYLGCLAHASYLVADDESRLAAVVDPQRDVDRYLDDARAAGFSIRYVFLTHFHADFLAGHLELRARTGAEICLGARARAEYEFTSLADGSRVSLGGVELEVLETPGHSPESISIVVRQRPGAPPHAVLTGDALFIGDVGRPDLRAALGWSADSLARLLYRSLREKLLALPDDTLVYPAHGAGSLCGKNLSRETVSTIGAQRVYNYALQPMSEDAFVALVTADQPDAPDYFTYDAVLNSRLHPTLDESLARALRPLPLEETLRLANAGAQLLDAREPAEFAGAHLAGSLNISLCGQYATWCGTLLDRDRPIAIVAAPGREAEAALRLGRIGFDHVAGYLDGGMQALARRRGLVRQVPRITAPALAEAPEQPFILDVRTPREWESGRIPGSFNIPLGHLRERLEEIPRTGPLVVQCQSGYRSSIAASLLAREGYANISDLVGGFAAWQASGLATVSGTHSAAASTSSTFGLPRRE